MGVAQALPGLQAADAQYQGGRPLFILQSPVQAGQVKEDQAGAGRQVLGAGNVLRGEADLVVGALLGKGLGKARTPALSSAAVSRMLALRRRRQQAGTRAAGHGAKTVKPRGSSVTDRPCQKSSSALK